MKTYILNKNKALRTDFTAGKDVRVEYKGFDQLTIALNNLGKDDLKWAKKMLRREAKPLVADMKSRIPKSDKSTSTTAHRHFTKGEVVTKIKTHKPGELRRSVGVVNSKKYRKQALIYVGPRKGVRWANDGWYGHFLEFGTQARYPERSKFLYSVVNGQLIKFPSAAGVEANPFVAPAIQGTGQKVFKNVHARYRERMGRKWENGGRA